MIVPFQGGIYQTILDPTLGSEQSGTRPVVVISGNTMNSSFPVSIICPISSKVKNFIGCVVLEKNEVNGLKCDSEILSFQIRTVSHKRLIQKIGDITPNQLKQVLEGLNRVLIY